MSGFVVVLFPDEAEAHAGLRALHQLHEEASATVYATALIYRESSGEIATVEPAAVGPIGSGVTTLASGLVRGDERLSDVGHELSPGHYAVVAEVDEDSTAPLDSRMSELGGRVMRRGRDVLTESPIEENVQAIRGELAGWGAERAGIKANAMDRNLSRDMEATRKKLESSAAVAQLQLERTKQEMDAKLDALAEQAAGAEPEVRSRLERRIAELRRDLSERADKLARAFQLTQEALHA
jgi:hypothetical protein